MNSNIFSFNRFKNLFVRDVFDNLRPIVTTIVGTFFALTLILFLILLFGKNADLASVHTVGFQDVVFPVAFIISALFVSGNAFRDFRNKEHKMSYLMLPSSTLEKFLSQYLIVTLVFTILMYVFYYLFGLLSMTIIDLSTEYSMSLGFPYDNHKIGLFLRIFIPIQLLLLAGAVTFKSKPLFRTALTGFLFSLAKSVIMVSIVYAVFSEMQGNYTLNDNFFLVDSASSLDDIKAEDFSLWSFKAYYYFIQYLMATFSMVYIWFKIKEKEA